MENYNKFKNANYGKKICAATEEGVVLFDPDSKKDVVGAEKMSYDEYLDVQINSFGKTRSYFASCYFNIAMGFKGQVEKIAKNNICFKRIYIEGMFADGMMFDGKEEHVWMNKRGFEMLKIGDCVSFYAEVYRYVKTGNGKQIDYSLRNPKGIKKIELYELPSDDDLLLQGIEQVICETCFWSEQCNKNMCMMKSKQKKMLKKQLFDIVKNNEKV